VRLRAPLGDELAPWLATLKLAGGRRFLRTFRLRSDVSEELEKKRSAVASYRSQLSGAEGGAEPWALDLVSEGDWLRCFEQPFELFRGSRLRP
jgi:hypothetical protein